MTPIRSQRTDSGSRTKRENEAHLPPAAHDSPSKCPDGACGDLTSLKTPACLWFPVSARSPLSSPGHVQSFALGFPNQCLRPVLPRPLPNAYIISSPSTSLPTTQTLPPYCTHYVEHSKYLLEKGDKWFCSWLS